MPVFHEKPTRLLRLDLPPIWKEHPMTQFELANSLRNLSQELDFLAAHATALDTEPNHRYITSKDILRGQGKLATFAFAPGYRDATLVLKLEEGQRLEVCLSVQDSLFLHEELTNMIEVAGPNPIGEGGR